MIGFVIAAIGAYVLGGVFNLNTTMADIIPGTIIFGIGIGLLLSQLTNMTMSAARTDQESDAAGLLNTFKNLGYSMGTALIGVLLIIGVFGGITASITATGQHGNMTTEQIQGNIINYVEKMQTGAPPQVSPQLQPYTTQIIDSSISSAMKQTFTVLSLILILGFITSIFIPSIKKKRNKLK